MAVESPKPELISEALQLATTLTEHIYNNVGELQGKSVAFTGSGPYLNSDLKLLLPGHIETIDIDEISEPESTVPESTVGLVVVGREDFDEPGLEVCVKSIHSTINFLPQEGFLDLVLFGYNWWTEHILELDSVLEYHEGLKFLHSLQNQVFTWPSTHAINTDRSSPGDIEFSRESDLYRLGYSIRTARGKPTSRGERWTVLERAISSKQIGLQNAAEHIAGLVRLRKTQPGGTEKYHYAIQEWESDLDRLKVTYFSDRQYNFEWPSTDP